MPIDRIAESGFGAGAEAYERARPGYPRDAVGWLAEWLGLGPGVVAVDIGAGTGKLTEVLLGLSGARVIALEPVAAMRERLVERIPREFVVGGAAEAIPFASGSAAAAVAAQAFHWFDAPRALAEIRRVLRPGGHLGLVWNVRDTSVGWVGEMARILDVHGDAIRRHETGTWRAAFPAPGYGPLEERSFPNLQTITPAGIVERAASTSFIARLPETARASVLEEIRTLVETHPDTAGRDLIDFPHQTRVYVTRRI